MQACIDGDSWLVDITAEADIVDFIIKNVNINLGLILNYYGVKGDFKFVVNVSLWTKHRSLQYMTLDQLEYEY
jgi:hypothetical protein